MTIGAEVAASSWNRPSRRSTTPQLSFRVLPVRIRGDMALTSGRALAHVPMVLHVVTVRIFVAPVQECDLDRLELARQMSGVAAPSRPWCPYHPSRPGQSPGVI